MDQPPSRAWLGWQVGAGDAPELPVKESFFRGLEPLQPPAFTEQLRLWMAALAPLHKAGAAASQPLPGTFYLPKVFLISSRSSPSAQGPPDLPKVLPISPRSSCSPRGSPDLPKVLLISLRFSWAWALPFCPLQFTPCRSRQLGTTLWAVVEQMM